MVLWQPLCDAFTGGANGNPNVCGAMTGGGSESILTMMKACRDYARYVRGIRQPEMIIGDSAHAAYFKGAEYFKIKLVMVPVGSDYRLSGKAVRKAVTRNTILVIASAPGFPHGVVDHIGDIAQVCLLLGFLPLQAFLVFCSSACHVPGRCQSLYLSCISHFERKRHVLC